MSRWPEYRTIRDYILQREVNATPGSRTLRWYEVFYDTPEKAGFLVSEPYQQAVRVAGNEERMIAWAYAHGYLTADQREMLLIEFTQRMAGE